MKLFPNFITIFLIFTLSSTQHTYCNNPSTENVVEIRNTSTSIINSTDKNRIEVNCILRPSIFSCNNTEGNIWIYYYYVNGEHQGLLKNPNNIQLMRFGDNSLEFDEGVKLPSFSSWFFDVYTCTHNTPILIRFRGIYRQAFYTLNPKTGKYTYHSIPCLKNREKVDENGLVYVEYNSGRNKNNEAYYDCIGREFLKLAQYICNPEKCSKLQTDSVPLLEIGVKLSKPKQWLRKLGYNSTT